MQRGTLAVGPTPIASKPLQNNNNSRENNAMSGSAATDPNLPWWKEPTKDQWYAYMAAWLGWTLDAFDFT